MFICVSIRYVDLFSLALLITKGLVSKTQTKRRGTQGEPTKSVDQVRGKGYFGWGSRSTTEMDLGLFCRAA